MEDDDDNERAKPGINVEDVFSTPNCLSLTNPTKIYNHH